MPTFTVATKSRSS